MKVIYQHSHLNGKEFLQVHFPDQLQEILDVIALVDGNIWKRSSERSKNQRAGRQGKAFAEVYSQKEINRQFQELFRAHGWDKRIYRYYATPEERIAREIMGLPAEQGKDIIEARGLTAYPRSNETDFVKSRIAVEVQFGKYSFVAYDFFVKHMAFFTADEIDVGVEIIPTNKMLQNMDSGPANYEGEIFNLYRQGRGTPAVPLWVLGIEP